MKRTVSIFLLIASFNVYSQTEKGRYLVGGTVGLDVNKQVQKDSSYITSFESNRKSLGGNLNVGYFLVDNIVAGISIGHTFQESEYFYYYDEPFTDLRNYRYNYTSFGLFGRAYTPPIARRFSFFGHLSFGYSKGKNTNKNTTIDANGIVTNTENNANINSFGVGLSPGFAFFLSDRLALEALFGSLLFSSYKSKLFDGNDRQTGVSNSSYFRVNFSPSSLFFGLSFYIGKGPAPTLSN